MEIRVPIFPSESFLGLCEPVGLSREDEKTEKTSFSTAKEGGSSPFQDLRESSSTVLLVVLTVEVSTRTRR
jgi:hypothetical protein